MCCFQKWREIKTRRVFCLETDIDFLSQLQSHCCFVRLALIIKSLIERNRKNRSKMDAEAADEIEGEQNIIINNEGEQWEDDERVEPKVDGIEDLSSPLIVAAITGDLDAAQNLLERGADKNETTNWGRSVLWKAAENGHIEIVRLLLELGADVNHISRKMLCRTSEPNFMYRVLPASTVLLIAAENGHLNVVQCLVEQGADMEKGDNDGVTPLIWATYKGHLEVVRYLLEQGANRDKADNEGHVALHAAAYRDHLEIAKLLMVYGVELNVENYEGRPPIDFTNNEEIRQAIRDEPRRRMDEAPGKRSTEQDQHPNAAISASAQREDEEKVEAEGVELVNKRPACLDEEVVAEEGVVADEDQDSEPSDEEDN